MLSGFLCCWLWLFGLPMVCVPSSSCHPVWDSSFHLSLRQRVSKERWRYSLCLVREYKAHCLYRLCMLWALWPVLYYESKSLIKFCLTWHVLEHFQINYPKEVGEVVSVIKLLSWTDVGSFYIYFLLGVYPCVELINVCEVCIGYLLWYTLAECSIDRNSVWSIVFLKFWHLSLYHYILESCHTQCWLLLQLLFFLNFLIIILCIVEDIFPEL